MVYVDASEMVRAYGEPSARREGPVDQAEQAQDETPETVLKDAELKRLGRISHKVKVRRVANAKTHSYSGHLRVTCVQAKKNSVFFACVRLSPPGSVTR
jgi:hypothetical protein